MNPLVLPSLTKHVTDYAAVLSPEQVESLSRAFADHETKTTEQVLTVLIPHRQGNELLDIGLKLFNENGIGQKNLNNGLLLIVATEEKKLRIITGKGMEIKYNEMVCREIVEKYLRPLLNEGKYEEMVKKWGEIVRDKIYTKNIPNITSNNSEILELEISPINTSSFIKKHLLATIPSTILIWISSLLDKDAAYIAIFMAISWIIVYALYSLFSKKTQEKIKIGLMISIVLSILILGIFSINFCRENPNSCKSGGSNSSSSSDYNSSNDSSSSSSYDGDGGSSNGGGYGD